MFDTNLNLVQSELWKTIYPVGCLFETTDSSFNPATHFGGTWEQYGAGRVTVGYSSGETEFNAGGKTGGAKTHTLTEAQMPSHNHTQNSHNHSVTINDRAAFNTGANSRSHSHEINSASSSTTVAPSAGTGVIGQQNSHYSGNESQNHVHVVPAHGHTGSIGPTTSTNNSTGSGQAHNNLQPYITVFRWRRTA